MSETYKTLEAIHELGAETSPDEIRAQRADGWDTSVKIVAEATHAARLSPEFSTTATRVMRWWRWNGFISDSIDAWIGSDNPEASAKRWVNHMQPQLDILASTGHVWYVETFNEQGLSEKHCRFDAAVGMELKAKYGDQIRIAAFSMSSGSFNEQRNWDLMLEHTIKPLTKEGVKFALSFHCYSSWLPSVGNLPGLQHADLAPRFPNIRWAELRMDDVPPFDIEYDGPRYDWTGFAVESMIRYFHRHGYGKTPLIVTEQHIDNMGNIGGHSAGGHYEWDEKGYYDFLKTELNVDVDTLLGRSLWYSERRYRAINKGGGNILAVFPFTYSDQDKFSRWYRHYRHKGGIFNTLKFLARTDAGQDKPDVDKPAFPDDGRFYVRTFKSDNVNVRPEPHTGTTIITQLSPFEVYIVTHQILNGEDVWLRVDYGFHTYAWVAYQWHGFQITELSHPIDALPSWGGSWDANDETWQDQPPDNGETTVSNLLGLRIENMPDVASLSPMMDALKPNFCTVVVPVGVASAIYVGSLLEAFPDTEFGVLFEFALDFGENIGVTTPGVFGPLRASATTSEAGEEHYNPNRAWNNWISTASANGHTLHNSLVALGQLPAEQRRRVRIISFYEPQFPNNAALDRDYVDFEKERTAQLFFEPYELLSIMLNNRGEYMKSEDFQMLTDAGIRFTIERYDGAIGRTDYAGAFLELYHAENQALPDGKLAKQPRDIINQTPVYEAARFHPDTGDLGSYLALRITRAHHLYNRHVPDTAHQGGVPIYLTGFGYRGDSGKVTYEKYYHNNFPLEGYKDNAPVWESWGLDPVPTLRGQIAYAVEQIGKVPQVRGIAFDNVFSGNARDVSGVAFYDVPGPGPDPDPEPEPEPGKGLWAWLLNLIKLLLSFFGIG